MVADFEKKANAKIGYSFSDQHLNEVIIHGLNSNPTAICFGCLFGDKSDYPAALLEARKCANLNLLAVDGAVLGTMDGDWHETAKTDNPLHAFAVVTGKLDGRTKARDERCKFILGGFMSLGNFLAHQTTLRDDSGESSK